MHDHDAQLRRFAGTLPSPQHPMATFSFLGDMSGIVMVIMAPKSSYIDSQCNQFYTRLRYVDKPLGRCFDLSDRSSSSKKTVFEG